MNCDQGLFFYGSVKTRIVAVFICRCTHYPKRYGGGPPRPCSARGRRLRRDPRFVLQLVYGFTIKRSTGHTHTHTPTENNSPDTDTHAHVEINTPNPQTNTSHKHVWFHPNWLGFNPNHDIGSAE